MAEDAVPPPPPVAAVGDAAAAPLAGNARVFSVKEDFSASLVIVGVLIFGGIGVVAGVLGLLLSSGRDLDNLQVPIAMIGTALCSMYLTHRLCETKYCEVQQMIPYNIVGEPKRVRCPAPAIGWMASYHVLLVLGVIMEMSVMLIQSFGSSRVAASAYRHQYMTLALLTLLVHSSNFCDAVTCHPRNYASSFVGFFILVLVGWLLYVVVAVNDGKEASATFITCITFMYFIKMLGAGDNVYNQVYDNNKTTAELLRKVPTIVFCVFCAMLAFSGFGSYMVFYRSLPWYNLGYFAIAYMAFYILHRVVINFNTAIARATPRIVHNLCALYVGCLFLATIIYCLIAMESEPVVGDPYIWRVHALVCLSFFVMVAPLTPRKLFSTFGRKALYTRIGLLIVAFILLIIGWVSAVSDDAPSDPFIVLCMLFVYTAVGRSVLVQEQQQ